MIGGDGRLQRGEHENLAVGADLENGAAAVADVEVVFAVEGDAGGHAHALDVDRHVAVGRRLGRRCRRSGWKHRAGRARSNASDGGVHQIVDERLHIEVEIDAIDRHRRLLPARSAEGGEDIAERIDGGVGHRMQAVGHQHADVAGPGFARLLSAARPPVRRRWRLRARARSPRNRSR